ARRSDISVQFTSPMGFLMHKYPARNHKKLVLIDNEISYLGGMNFTEHNFRWADLMVRHVDPALNRALNSSFESDRSNSHIEPVHQIDGATKLFVLNGYKTKAAYNELLHTVANAKKVIAISPYISYPMLDA